MFRTGPVGHLVANGIDMRRQCGLRRAGGARPVAVVGAVGFRERCGETQPRSHRRLLEHLRDGTSREDVALGCMRAIAERILELGVQGPSVVITGGVPEYFPGVLKQLEELSPTGVNLDSRLQLNKMIFDLRRDPAINLDLEKIAVIDTVMHAAAHTAAHAMVRT